MPRQTRSSRSRSRSRRTATAVLPSSEATLTGSESATLPPITTPTATVVRPMATPGSLTRGFLTDYGYVVGELKRILVLTVGIVALLVILWLILG